MKNKFWKVATIASLLLWAGTLFTWYAIKTTPPRYLTSEGFYIDTHENKFFDYQYRTWRVCDVNSTSKEYQCKYIEEIYGIGPDLYDLSKTHPIEIINKLREGNSAEEICADSWASIEEKYNIKINFLDRVELLRLGINKSQIQDYLDDGYSIQAIIEEWNNNY